MLLPASLLLLFVLMLPFYQMRIVNICTTLGAILMGSVLYYVLNVGAVLNCHQVDLNAHLEVTLMKQRLVLCMVMGVCLKKRQQKVHPSVSS